MNEEERLLAQFAASVSKTLKDVDSKMIGKTVNGPANKINPYQFVKQPVQQHRQAAPVNQIKQLDMVQAPKATPAGREVIDQVPFNPGDVMIPMDGLDEETRKAVMAHSNAPQARSHPGVEPTVLPTPPAPQQLDLNIPSSSELEKALALIKKMEKESKAKKPKRGEPEWDLAQCRKGFNYIKRKMNELEKKIDAVLGKKCGCSNVKD